MELGKTLYSHVTYIFFDSFPVCLARLSAPPAHNHRLQGARFPPTILQRLNMSPEHSWPLLGNSGSASLAR